jgi:hypothetical protein
MHARSIFSRLLGRSASIWLSAGGCAPPDAEREAAIHHQLWQQQVLCAPSGVWLDSESRSNAPVDGERR